MRLHLYARVSQTVNFQNTTSFRMKFWPHEWCGRICRDVRKTCQYIQMCDNVAQLLEASMVAGYILRRYFKSSEYIDKYSV
jgi:hypothetical protein